MDYSKQYESMFSLVKNKKNKEFINEFKDIDEIMFDIDVKDSLGNNFMSYAIVTNNIEIVKFLLTKNIKLDIETPDGHSLLIIPIIYLYFEIIEILLEADKNIIGISIVNYRDKNNKIPLHYAIETKNINVVKMLLDYGASINYVDNKGCNALFYAVSNNMYDLCKIAVSLIANINVKNCTGENILHIACNTQQYDIVNLLIENGANINAYDNNEMTPLHYCIKINNIKLTKLLIDKKCNINTQDINGNTVLHYSIIENIFEIFEMIVVHEKIIFNLWNIYGDIPLHLIFKNYKNKSYIKFRKYIKLMIEKSNLNMQNNLGNSSLFYIVKYNLWRKYKETIKTKKLDIFVKNSKNIMLFNYVEQNDKNEFIDLIVDSYLYNLKTFNKLWISNIDIVCSKSFEMLTTDEIKNIKVCDDDELLKHCKKIIKKKINDLIDDKETCKTKSYPTIRPFLCYTVGAKINYCTFTGNVLDVLIGLIYLLKKHNSVCGIVNYHTNDIDISQNLSSLFNFELVWANRNLVLNRNFDAKFLKCIENNQFTIIPIAIDLIDGGHAGYLIYDKKKNEIERFETYGGGDTLYSTSYDGAGLDILLERKFASFNKDIKYIKPLHFLPKISFQLFDIIENKKKQIGDPIGFCVLWSIWYVDMRLTYKDINREKLVKILIDNLKHENISFKTMIRNYSSFIVNIRDKLLDISKMNINDWLNGQYTKKQLFAFLMGINNELKTLKI